MLKDGHLYDPWPAIAFRQRPSALLEKRITQHPSRFSSPIHTQWTVPTVFCCHSKEQKDTAPFNDQDVWLEVGELLEEASSVNNSVDEVAYMARREMFAYMTVGGLNEVISISKDSWAPACVVHLGVTGKLRVYIVEKLRHTYIFPPFSI